MAEVAPGDSPLAILRAALQEARREVELDLRRVEALLATTRTDLHKGGHRVRPLLVLLAARACEAPAPGAAELALAAELVHTASLLVHDLLDGGEHRRGRRALHLREGPRAAALAGTQLVAEAFRIVASTGADPLLLADLAAVVRDMTESERAEGETHGDLSLAPADREELNLLKTGRLIEWSTRAGAHAAGADVAVESALASFGRRLGAAYQHLDDLFDLVADPVVLGKDAFVDVTRGRMTLPLILGARRSSRVAALLGEAWSESLSPMGRGAQRERLREELLASGALVATAEHIVEGIDAACRDLGPVPDNPARERLEGIARAVGEAGARAAKAP